MCREEMFGAPPWMWGAMWGRGSGKHGHAERTSRARARWWMYENPSDDEIIEMLEEHQRDLEQEVANLASRIKELKDARAASNS